MAEGERVELSLGVDPGLGLANQHIAALSTFRMYGEPRGSRTLSVLSDGGLKVRCNFRSATGPKLCSFQNGGEGG